MKQLAFKEWKSGKKQQLPIEGTGQDHPAGGSPARRPPNIWTFLQILSVPIHQPG